MRVLLDTTYALRASASGTGVYLERLAAVLSREPGIQLIEAANSRRRPPGAGGLGSLRNAWSDEWWLEVELPRRARAERVDLIHHPLPARSWTTQLPQVITVHDLAFERLPGAFSPTFRRHAAVAHRHAARHAAAVLCVSRATAGEVATLWGVPGRRIVIAPHGPGQELTALARREPTHFLYVGDDEPRKNVPLLLDAFRSYGQAADRPLDLVLAGASSGVPAGPGIHVERAPSAQRLAELHAGAAALVHPSRYEGFGLTLLEAMRLGTPVIAARIPAVREVGGDAVHFVSPMTRESLAAAMLVLGGDPGARSELAERGSRHVRAFSWSTSAHQHMEAYSLAVTR
jgi:glycosyltransferase involved in cell wall biosynthesis